MPYKDPEKRNLYLQKYHQENKDRKAKYDKEYREKNKEQLRKKDQEYYKKNRARMMKKFKERYWQRRDEIRGIRLPQERKSRNDLRFAVLSHYSFGEFICACCKEIEPRFLTIDHIKGNGNRHRKELKMRGGINFYRWLRRNNFPDGFQVLCMNCNFAKSVYPVCPHKINEKNKVKKKREK